MPHTIRLFLISCCLLCFAPLCAFVDVESMHFTTVDGLSDNSIRCMHQDSRGFLWIGTLNGLSRYDGNRFVTFLSDKSTQPYLVDQRIKSFYEDRNGFLWIRSRSDVIACYDLRHERFVDFTGCGQHVQPYQSLLETSDGSLWLWDTSAGCRKVSYTNGTFASVVFSKEQGNLPDNRVEYVFEDSARTIWVGTDQALYRLCGDQLACVLSQHRAFQAKQFGQSVYFFSQTGEVYCSSGQSRPQRVAVLPSSSLGSEPVSEFSWNHLWYVFGKKGGCVFNTETRQFQPDSLCKLEGVEVVEDNAGNPWLFNHSGCLRYFDRETGRVKALQLIQSDQVLNIDRERFQIMQDHRGIFWISTYGNGLFAYDPKQDLLRHLCANDQHITNDFLLCLLLDHTDGLWVGTEYTGLSHVSVLNEGADRIFPEEAALVDRSNAVRMLAEIDGRVYLGTRRGGLYAYDNLLDHPIERSFSESSVYAMLQDSKGRLWKGNRFSGLELDGRRYLHSAEDEESLSSNFIFTMLCDSKDRLWIGTLEGGLNLAVEQGDSLVFRRFLHQLDYGSRQVRSLCEDHHGRIWAGTSAGVYVFRPEELLSDSTKIQCFNIHNARLRNNEVRCIHQDSHQQIWLGTAGAGITMCEYVNESDSMSFLHFDTRDGLVNNMVQSFLEDSLGRMWVATEYGMSCFDLERRRFDNYFFSTSVLGNVYSENTSLKIGERLCFGTNSGVVLIDPIRLQRPRNGGPKVSFTNLLIDGNIVHPFDNESPLEQSLVYADKMELPYDQNSFSVEFSTFDYAIKNKTRFSYRLENYDDEWSVPSTLNFAAYKNLPAGNYRLRVRARNGEGVWSDCDYSLGIVIRPPWWARPWAFLLYALLCLSIAYFSVRLILHLNQLRNKVEVEKRLTEYKLVFFTNISHEFRTPLTLIQGSLEKLKKQVGSIKETKSTLKQMEKSTQRMMRLITQLLDFRKAQHNKLTLHVEELDVVPYLKDIFLCFQETAEAKRIDYRFVSSESSHHMFVDKSCLDKIVYNLLSNSFKFTPEAGRISLHVCLNCHDRLLVIQVKDTGVGVPEEKRAHLFERFYSDNSAANSMGIGLHLTKELVELHRGSISYYENDGGQGSIFEVCLPLDKSVYAPEELSVPSSAGNLSSSSTPTEISLDDEELSFTVPEPLNQRKVLIIEDDADVRRFLEETIGDYFEVVAESDGLSGYQRAQTFDADLIVSDVMMPGLSGYELSAKLKEDFSTCHIPIVLLTALDSDEKRYEGIRTGADAYLTKPFSPKLLLATIVQLIEQRDKLRMKFSQSAEGLSSTAICTNEKDKDFVERLSQITEENYANPNFGVDDFAAQLGLGRTMFYRKLKALTAYSPNEYLRMVRMQKAAELLKKGNLTVAEVAYKVGVNDPFYFSKCFKQQFGVSPSKYVSTTE